MLTIFLIWCSRKLWPTTTSRIQDSPSISIMSLMLNCNMYLFAWLEPPLTFRVVWNPQISFTSTGLVTGLWKQTSPHLFASWFSSIAVLKITFSVKLWKSWVPTYMFRMLFIRSCKVDLHSLDLLPFFPSFRTSSSLSNNSRLLRKPQDYGANKDHTLERALQFRVHCLKELAIAQQAETLLNRIDTEIHHEDHGTRFGLHTLVRAILIH